MTKRAESARSAARSLFLIMISFALLTGCASDSTQPNCARENSCEPPSAPATDAPPITSPSQPGDMPETRSFQMALWDNVNAIDADLAFFSEGQAQPADRSILRLTSWWNGDAKPNASFAPNIAAYQYDWSRIAAVLIDEPYWYNTGAKDRSNPCRTPTDPRNERIARTATQLANAAAVINNVSPSTRVWVNFSVPELRWAKDSECPVRINQPYIDVISVDSYGGSFAELVEPHYEWLSANRATPYQQFALIPGTFFRSGIDNQHVQASYLEGYFEYANAANQRCNLPLGRVGVTGSWDGCPVWLVLGWLASTRLLSDGNVWHGVLDPLSTVIAAEWKAQLAHPKLNPMIGKVESYDPVTKTFTGWAIDANSTGRPPQIEVWLDDRYLGDTIANRQRPDLAKLYGRNRTGFSFTIDEEHLDGRCGNTRIFAVSSTAEPHNRLLLPPEGDMQICLER